MAKAKINLIKKTDLLGDIVSEHPEVVPVLASAGLHCIGCHVSVYESLEDGCLSHGLTKKDIEKLVKDANKKITQYKKMPAVSFSTNAVLELAKRIKSSKTKYVRIVNSFGGEFDFEPTDTKIDSDVLVNAAGNGNKVSILADKTIERMLRGIIIDYDSNLKDFTAKRIE
jgi:hybrid cluster-associated redox disulfide protein